MQRIGLHHDVVVLLRRSCNLEEILRVVQVDLALRDHGQVLGHALAAGLRLRLRELLDLDGAAASTLVLVFRELGHVRAVRAEPAEAAEAEVVVFTEDILLQTFGRLFSLGVMVTLLGLNLARLLTAWLQLVRIVAREDQVLDLQFLLVEHALKAMDLLLVLYLVNSLLLQQLLHLFILLRQLLLQSFN